MLLKSHTGNLFVRRVRRWSKFKFKYQQTIFIAQRPNLLPQGSEASAYGSGLLFNPIAPINNLGGFPHVCCAINNRSHDNGSSCCSGAVIGRARELHPRSPPGVRLPPPPPSTVRGRSHTRNPLSPLGRHRWAFGRRLGVGLRPELVQAFLDRGQVGLQTLKCGTSRIGKRIDLLAQGLEFCRRQIVACEAFPYLRQGSLMLAEIVTARQLVGLRRCRRRLWRHLRPSRRDRK